MLDALQRLETDINELPPGVNPDLEGIGKTGGSHGGGSHGSGGGGGHGHGPSGDHPGGGHHDDEDDEDEPHGDIPIPPPPGHPGKGDNPPGHQPEDELPPDEPLDSPYDNPIGPELPGDDLNPLDEENILMGGGILGGALGNQNKDDEDSDEEEVEEEAPEYVSGANAGLKQELDEKQVLLQDAQVNLLAMQSEVDQKRDHLGRLEAAFAANHDPKLADRINQLRVEVAELDANITYDQQMVDTLDVEVDELAKRWSFVELPPGANVEKIRALEGGETSQWIKDATRNEDNSVNCVNYVVNRMPIPGELPLNAHLWDEQANKFATELGIKVGDVPAGRCGHRHGARTFLCQRYLRACDVCRKSGERHRLGDG